MSNLAIHPDELAQSLADAWVARRAMAQTTMQVENIMFKLGLVEDIMHAGLYGKHQKGAGAIIEKACELTGIRKSTVYDCLALYEKCHEKGRTLAETAGHIVKEFGSVRKALGKGDSETVEITKECRHCPMHCNHG